MSVSGSVRLSTGTGIPATTSGVSAPYPLTNTTATPGPTGTSPVKSSGTVGLSTGTGNYTSTAGSSAPYPFTNSTITTGPTGTSPPGTSVMGSITESELPVSTSGISAPYPFTNSSTSTGPTGTSSSGTGAIISSSGTGISTPRPSFGSSLPYFSNTSSTAAATVPLTTAISGGTFSLPSGQPTISSGPGLSAPFPFTNTSSALPASGTGVTSPDVSGRPSSLSGTQVTTPTATVSSQTPPFPLSNTTSVVPTGGASSGLPSSGFVGSTGHISHSSSSVTSSANSTTAVVPTTAPTPAISLGTSSRGPSSGGTGTAPYPLTNSTAVVGPTGTSAPSSGIPVSTGGSFTSTSSPPFPVTNSTRSTGPTGVPSSTVSESELPISGTGPTSSLPLTSSLSAPYHLSNTTVIASATGSFVPPFPISNSTFHPGPTGTNSVPPGLPTSSPVGGNGTVTASALPTTGPSSIATTTGPGSVSSVSATGVVTPTSTRRCTTRVSAGTGSVRSTTSKPIIFTPPYPSPNGTVPYNTTCTGETAPPRVTHSQLASTGTRPDYIPDFCFLSPSDPLVVAVVEYGVQPIVYRANSKFGFAEEQFNNSSGSGYNDR
ncbi:hypothetical protein V8F20_000829 [Naviculisporaceae sp. PSN 640]